MSIYTGVYTAAMQEACKAALGSPDPSTQNGAVLSSISGFVCYDTLACNRFPRLVKYSNERWERPIKYSFIEHAERNCIYSAARLGIRAEGKVLVCPWAACADCARAIIEAGIIKLVTLPRAEGETNARWVESIQVADTMLIEAGVEIEFYEGLVGTPPLRRDGELLQL